MTIYGVSNQNKNNEDWNFMSNHQVSSVYIPINTIFNEPHKTCSKLKILTAFLKLSLRQLSKNIQRHMYLEQ